MPHTDILILALSFVSGPIYITPLFPTVGDEIRKLCRAQPSVLLSADKFSAHNKEATVVSGESKKIL